MSRRLDSRLRGNDAKRGNDGSLRHPRAGGEPVRWRDACPADWIPAFAGMTMGPGMARGPEMTARFVIPAKAGNQYACLL